MPNILDFEDWLEQIACPPPAAGEADFGFYHAWGYEQWLIKSYQCDYERAEITMRSLYNLYLITCHLPKGQPVIESLRGRPIVRAARALHQWPMTSVPKGFPGVVIFEDAKQGAMVIFPAHFEAFVGFVPANVIEQTGATLEDIDGLLAQRSGNHPAISGSLEAHFCVVPGVNEDKPIYVGHVYNHSMGNDWHATLYWYDATQFLKKDGSYREPAKKYRESWNRKFTGQETRFNWNDADAARLQSAEIIA